MTFLMTKLVYVYHKTQLFDFLREWKKPHTYAPFTQSATFWHVAKITR